MSANCCVSINHIVLRLQRRHNNNMHISIGYRQIEISESVTSHIGLYRPGDIA